MKRCALSLTLFLLTLPSLAVADLSNPAGFTESMWLDTASEVTCMAWAPDGSGRLFLTRKGGQVRIVQRNPGGGGTLVAAPFATISPIVVNNESGLDSIAFDPDFVNNGYVYFFVTVSFSEQQIIRYTANGNVGMDKMTIVSGLPTRGENHNGAGMGFGADGMLYWAVGDNGNGTGVDADMASLAAKVGRATRTGALPLDNPFADGPGGNQDFIWARGMRNPFTMTFQPTTGLMWLNVVGDGFEQVFVVRSGDHAGYNDFENDQPTGYITPVIAYETYEGAPRTYGISAISRTNNVVTITTTGSGNTDHHHLRQGARVVVAGVANTSFNGTFYVQTGVDAGTSRTFSYPQNGTDASSNGGTVATLTQGRTLSGGFFYDATAFPAAYRGNFFYSDYSGGRTMRAVVGPGTTVQSVDHWSTNLDHAIDNSVGPDGALYTASLDGPVYRTVATPAGQNIIVSNQHMRMLEGGDIVVTVSLAQAPGGSVTVNAARTAGDADVTVAAGAALTFTAANWMDPQILRIHAAQDADTPNDTATITVSSTGLASQTVDVEVIDDETQAIVLSSTAVTVNEGANGTFDVSLATAPATAVTVNVARTGGDTDVTVTGGASLMFTPANFATPQTVTVAAADDADNVDDTATITVSTSVAESRTVAITVQEDEDRAPAITSTPVTTATVDAAYTYDVQGNGAPAPTYVLITAPNGMTIDSVTGVITWTPGRTGEFAVTVRAENGVSPDATQMFTITVTGDGSDGGGGCSCRMGQSASDAGGYLAIALLGMVIARRRRAR